MYQKAKKYKENKSKKKKKFNLKIKFYWVKKYNKTCVHKGHFYDLKCQRLIYQMSSLKHNQKEVWGKEGHVAMATGCRTRLHLTKSRRKYFITATCREKLKRKEKKEKKRQKREKKKEQ
ncbi:hypothetical protein CEXT_239131 [Caerostris extrusa]|uniref:Uncharacterized protein n=1 Tax=Caerostris extrusa TaxID=172846 RepID=A0AAV4PIQ8_CAEEX|nr:hypothetical protein CEXT_239131 [Caerostris extrusa]